MKYLIKIFVSIFLIFYTTNLYSENLIAFLDMDKLMIESKAGKSISLQLEKLHKKNLNYFKKKEEDLKSKESKIVSQKNVLSKEEFEKKIISLREEADKYRIERRDSINSLTKKRVEATNELLKTIQPILTTYSDKKSIAILMQKKNIIIGKNELDITNDILIELNKKLNKVKID